MKYKIRLWIAMLAMVSATVSASAQTMEVSSVFNPLKVILPSSQYTPETPYSASIWVFNEGKRYADEDYNRIWAIPEADTDGRHWYDPAYRQGDVSGWQSAQAPFSSDEYYMGQRSHQWITSDITGEIYIRRSFTLSSIPEGTIYLACGHDDGPSEWYINGEPVHTVSDGWNNDEYCPLSDDQKALLKTDGSDNVMAVHVHQNWGGAFADCGLYGADMSLTRTFLNTVTNGEWPCRYYMLNYNSDIPVAEAAGWATETEDEADWVEGVGPMSNDANMFLVTRWPSQLRPILIRRHFSLTEDDLVSIAEGNLSLVCSYDEEPKVYLNGTLIWSASGWNDNDYASYSLTDVQKDLLHEGDNVLAVSLAQGGGGGHIDYGLRIVAPYVPDGVTGIPDSDSAASSRIYNLHGQYLGSSADGLPRGIYIVGGKKTVIK